MSLSVREEQVVSAEEHFIAALYQVARWEFPEEYGSASRRTTYDYLSPAKSLALYETLLTFYRLAGDPFRDELPELQDRLREAISRLNEALVAAKSLEKPSPEQVAGVRTRLPNVFAATRAIVLPEWERAVEALLEDVETWVKSAGGLVRRDKATIEGEAYLGSYSLTQILFFVEGQHFLVDPVSRFVPGARGLVDFRAVPSHSLVLIPRLANGWMIEIEPGPTSRETVSVPWSETAFREGLLWLKANA